MLLAGMGPNIVIDGISDLGTRDIDRNHDWINESKQRYNNDDLVEVDTFVSRNSSEGQENIEGKEENYVDYQTLNKKQGMYLSE